MKERANRIKAHLDELVDTALNGSERARTDALDELRYIDAAVSAALSKQKVLASLRDQRLAALSTDPFDFHKTMMPTSWSGRIA